MSYVVSPNMNLQIPGVGSEAGPNYAQDVNNSLTTIDAHNHTAGSGVLIPVAGLNINTDLPIGGNNVTGIRASRFLPQSAPLVTPSDLAELFVQSVDLYYIDGNGNTIRITQGGSLSGTAGTITGLPSGTASASYAAGTFVFQSATTTSANIDGGSFILRNNVSGSNGVTLSPPSSLPANYTLTLPNLPSTISAVNIDTSGNIGTLTYAQLVQTPSNLNLSGKAVQEQGLNVVVSNTNAATNSLSMIRYTFDGSGSFVSGEGISNITHSGTGVYDLTFSSAFGDDATVVATVFGSSAAYCTVNAPTASTVQIRAFSSGGTAQDNDICVIAIGQRA